MRQIKATGIVQPSCSGYIYSNINILLIFLCLPALLFAQDKKFEFAKPMMGSQFKLVFYAPGDSVAISAARAVFNHIGHLNEIMSDYLDGSEVNRLSALSGSGYWIRPGDKLLAILDSARILSGMTDGTFDVTVGPVTQVWRRASRLNRFPDRDDIRKALKSKGYRLMEIDRQNRLVKLKKPGMRIDLGGIGKGYAADEGIRILESMGIRSALVDAGGDLALSAPPPGEKGWKISVSSGTASESDEVIVISNCGVATSGNTYRYIEHEGKKYSHIVDPKTGIGLTREVRATVIAPTGTRADALAKAVSVASLKKSRRMIKRKFPEVRVWLLEKDIATGKMKSWNTLGQKTSAER